MSDMQRKLGYWSLAMLERMGVKRVLLGSIAVLRWQQETWQRVAPRLEQLRDNLLARR